MTPCVYQISLEAKVVLPPPLFQEGKLTVTLNSWILLVAVYDTLEHEATDWHFITITIPERQEGQKVKSFIVWYLRVWVVPSLIHWYD